MRRIYTDEGRVHVGAFVAPAVKRRLVERAFQDRVTVSDVIRAALDERLAHEQPQTIT